MAITEDPKFLANLEYIHKQNSIKSQKIVTILIPCYNEEACLELCYNRIKDIIEDIPNYKFELLFINDGSKDHTLSILKNLHQQDDRVSYIDLSRNFGKENAMLSGFDYAHGDAIIIMDADLQDPPELIPTMITYWEQGYNDVYAQRKSRDGESFLKKWTSHTYYKTLQKFTNIPIQQDTGDFRLLDKKCIDAIKTLRETQRYTKGLFSWIGFNKKAIYFDRPARAAGQTKWNYYKLMNLAIDGFTSFTTAPLRMATIFGGVLSFIAFIYMLIIIFKTLILGNDLAGYPSLISVILFMGGIQLLFLGIIGEYIGRIFMESKERPTYIINDYIEADKYKDSNK